MIRNSTRKKVEIYLQMEKNEFRKKISLENVNKNCK